MYSPKLLEPDSVPYFAFKKTFSSTTRNATSERRQLQKTHPRCSSLLSLSPASRRAERRTFPDSRRSWQDQSAETPARDLPRNSSCDWLFPRTAHRPNATSTGVGIDSTGSPNAGQDASVRNFVKRNDSDHSTRRTFVNSDFSARLLTWDHRETWSFHLLLSK